MTKITDPYSFLRKLVTHKGRSDVDGVILTAVSVQADALEDFNYQDPQWNIERDIRNVFARDENNWNRLLVGSRQSETEIVHPISFLHTNEPVTVYFITEGHFMSAMVFLPTVMLDEFQYEVTLFQRMLREVASFADKEPDTLKFVIGVAISSWDDMVECGEAQEVEIPA